MFNNVFPENHALYERNGIAGQATDNNKRVIWRARITCWIHKDTNTYPYYEYVILTVFPTAAIFSRTRPNITL
jgi:hypothetical protein